jgi:hypothetical protein
VSREAEPASAGGTFHSNLQTCKDTYLDDQKKSFWLLFTLLSPGAFFLPLAWGVAETCAALFVSWWVIYRSGIY